jgi:chromosome segregation ATPase
MSGRHPYDLETEIETMAILKSQNKKIHELLEELKRKDDILIRVQNDNQKYIAIVKENDIYKENLNFQINALGEKFKALEKEGRDRITQITEECGRLKKVEKGLLQDLSDKEKMLGEYIAVVERHEEQIKNLRSEIVDKNTTIHNFEVEKSELTGKIKNYIIQMDLLSEEIEFVRKDHSQRARVSSDMKIKLEDKVDESISLLKHKDNEIKILSEKCIKLEQDNVSLHTANKKYKSEIDDLVKQIQTIKEEIAIYKQLDRKLKDCEEFAENQSKLLEFERRKNNELNEIINQLKEEILTIKESYAGERSPEYLNQLLKSKSEEIMNLNNEIVIFRTRISEWELIQKECDIEISIYNNFLYGYLGTLMQWIETYVGTAITDSCNITVPDLKFDLRKQKLLSNKLKTRMEKCQGSIQLTHNRIKTQFDSLDRSNGELRNENLTLIDERTRLIQEIKDLTNEKETLIEELHTSKDRFDKFMKELDNATRTLDSLKEVRSVLQNMNKQYLDHFAYEVKVVKDGIARNNKLMKYAEMLSLSQHIDIVIAT